MRSTIRFEQAIKSEATKRNYRYCLSKFLEFARIKDSDGLLQLKDSALQTMVEDYLFTLKKRIELDPNDKNYLNPNSVPAYFYGLKLFFAMNDKVLNWTKIEKMFPARVKTTGKNAYTTAHIQKMLYNTTSKKIRSLIHILASTGCRIGAVAPLKLKHVKDIEDCKAIVFYEGSTEEYIGFLTPEASKSLDEYLDERKRHGELLTDESPLIRKRYRIAGAKAQHNAQNTLEIDINHIIKKAGIPRVKIGRRYNIQMDHGFRKRFDTILKDNKLGNLSLKEKLMSHRTSTIPLDSVYHDPSIQTMFEEFKLHIPNLTVDDSERLKLQNAIKDETIKKMESEKDIRITNLENKLSVIEKLLDQGKRVH